MYVDVHNRRYWVEDEGKGPILLMLHGFTGSTRTFDLIVRRLRGSFRILRMDLPGHAKTNSVGQVMMEDFCKDLAAILKQLRVPSLSILGYSLGGRTALSFAILNPSLVDQVLLESASPGLCSSKDRIARQAKDQALAKKIKEDGLPAFVSYWENISLFKTQEQLPKLTKEAIKRERLNHNPIGLIESLEGMGTGQQPSWWDRLPEIRTKVVLVTGSEDSKFVNINRCMHEQLRFSFLTEVDGAGHTVHLENPGVFANIVEDFML